MAPLVREEPFVFLVISDREEETWLVSRGLCFGGEKQTQDPGSRNRNPGHPSWLCGIARRFGLGLKFDLSHGSEDPPLQGRLGASRRS
jgi:hypothetical protein